MKGRSKLIFKIGLHSLCGLPAYIGLCRVTGIL